VAVKIQSAVKENAAELAYLINLAGEGIPEYLWSEMAEKGQDPMEVGRLRALREEGGFSYKNAITCVENGSLQGMIISYKQPDPYVVEEIEEYPEIVKPLVLLEAKAPGSWYINGIATFEKYRGKGIARKLLSDAEERAISAACSEMSLIVASENARAKTLYEYIGYESVSSLPVVRYPGCLHGGEWLLMVKRLK
jgi:ribosomal protein S18 acetylase RimI-like enzyme